MRERRVGAGKTRAERGENKNTLLSTLLSLCFKDRCRPTPRGEVRNGSARELRLFVRRRRQDPRGRSHGRRRRCVFRKRAEDEKRLMMAPKEKKTQPQPRPRPPPLSKTFFSSTEDAAEGQQPPPKKKPRTSLPDPREALKFGAGGGGERSRKATEQVLPRPFTSGGGAAPVTAAKATTTAAKATITPAAGASNERHAPSSHNPFLPPQLR